MLVIYEAESSIDAHLLRGLLAQQDIDARILGEYLQGGSGELPATGLVTVMVPEEDAAAARQVVCDFEDNRSLEGPPELVDWSPPSSDAATTISCEHQDAHPPTHPDRLARSGLIVLAVVAALLALAVILDGSG